LAPRRKSGANSEAGRVAARAERCADAWLARRQAGRSSAFQEKTSKELDSGFRRNDEQREDEPKEDEPKEDEPKEDEPKEDEPKKDEPKKDEPKKDEPKRTSVPNSEWK
jgi:outer membrane biosynthesis protein TonB